MNNNERLEVLNKQLDRINREIDDRHLALQCSYEEQDKIELEILSIRKQQAHAIVNHIHTCVDSLVALGLFDECTEGSYAISGIALEADRALNLITEKKI